MTEEKSFKKTEWKDTNKRFVAFLDILGFKDLVLRKSHDEIYSLLKETSSIKETVQKTTGLSDFTKEFKDSEVHIVNFSDSIAIFSKNDSLENFNYFVLAVRWVFTKSIKVGLPMKGSFSHGIVSINRKENIFFGQPIIDAYLMEEDINYMGVVAHNSIDAFINENKEDCSKLFNQKIIFEDKTTLKCGNLVHLNLNWFSIMKVGDYNDLKSLIENYRLNASGNARKYIDNTLEMLEKVKHLL